MKLKYSFLDNRVVYDAIRGLSEQPLKGSVSYKVNKIIKGLDSGGSQWREKYDSFVKEYGAKNEDGTPVMIMSDPDADGVSKPTGFKMQDDEAASKAFQEIYNSEFEMDASPLLAYEIMEAKISPDHLRVIEPIIADSHNL